MKFVGVFESLGDSFSVTGGGCSWQETNQVHGADFAGSWQGVLQLIKRHLEHLARLLSQSALPEKRHPPASSGPAHAPNDSRLVVVHTREAVSGEPVRPGTEPVLHVGLLRNLVGLLRNLLGWSGPLLLTSKEVMPSTKHEKMPKPAVSGQSPFPGMSRHVHEETLMSSIGRQQCSIWGLGC